MNALAGRLAGEQAGDVLANGVSLQKAARSRLVSMMPQDDCLFEALTVEETLLWGGPRRDSLVVARRRSGVFARRARPTRQKTLAAKDACGSDAAEAARRPTRQKPPAAAGAPRRPKGRGGPRAQVRGAAAAARAARGAI